MFFKLLVLKKDLSLFEPSTDPAAKVMRETRGKKLKLCLKTSTDTWNVKSDISTVSLISFETLT